MSYTGINNENEFFTSHYLSEVFPNDVKEVISTWQDKHKADKDWQMPYRTLSTLAKDYFQFLDEFNKKKHNDTEKIALARSFYMPFIEALGYKFSFAIKNLDEGQVPIIAELTKNNGATHLWLIEAYSTEAIDSLTLQINKAQLPEPNAKTFDKNLEEIISSDVFTLEEPPR